MSFRGRKKQNGFQSLKKRVLFVVFGLIIFRFGVHIPIPYIKAKQLLALMEIDYSTSNGLFKIFNLFSGGALTKLSIFSLGIMPYISSSIIFQVLQSISPKLIEMKKEGYAFQSRINQYVKYLSVLISSLQALGIASYIYRQTDLISIDSIFLFYSSSVMSMVAGSMFLVWLGEQITDKGVGNGTSLFIFIGIVSNMPFEIANTFEQAYQGHISIYVIWFLILMFILVVFSVTFVERAQRLIIVNYPKRQQGRKMYMSQSSYLPLKLNIVGVVPAIFASSVLLIFGMLCTLIANIAPYPWILSIKHLIQPGSSLYTLIFSVSVVFFSFFYSNLVFNPKETADNIKKSGAFVSGIRPGSQTVRYIKSIMNKLVLISSLYIVLICLIPVITTSIWKNSFIFSFGGTSLLIMVTVVIDFMSQIQSYVMSMKYDSLLKKRM